MDNKFERVEPDDPKRCQSVGQHGQCPFKAVDPSKYCLRHGATLAIKKENIEQVRVYNLAIWQSALEKHTDNPNIKSLREEVGIMRIVLQSIIEKCKDTTDLLVSSGRIIDICVKLEKVVISCSRLEAATGQTLDRSAALHFAARVVEIVHAVLQANVPEDLADVLVDQIGEQLTQELAKPK